MTMRKVLYSPGFGAGWYSWHGHKELLFDPVLIQLVEDNKHVIIKGSRRKKVQHVSDEFKTRCEELVKDKDVYYGGVYKLKVAEVNGPFQIEEYDGNESIVNGKECL